MDRNTLVAFFLIALIMIFTPYYIPPQEQQPIAQKTHIDSLIAQAPAPVIKKSIANIPQIKASRKPGAEERVVKIETNLYRATLSSINGGSLKAFSLKDYKQKDSSFVELINGVNNQNLLLSYLSEDGEIVELSEPWELSYESISYGSKKPSKVSFLTYIGPNNNLPVEKTLVFYPDNYSIDITVDFSGAKADLLNGNIILSWNGGLTSTEPNIKDDQTYFYSYAFQGGELHDLKVKKDESQKDDLPGKTDWVAIRSKYFVTALIPERPELTLGAGVYGEYKEKETYSASLMMVGSAPTTTKLYLGPLEFNRVRDLGVELERIMNFGWGFIKPISKGILWLLKKMYTWIPNYGFVLIIFSFLVKIVVFPLTKKSYQSTQAMQAVQPEINALKEKYKSNPNKLNQATMQLYKEKGVNPLGGCIPMLIQMPLLFGLFTVFRTTIELRGKPFGLWITDLSAPDTIFHLPFTVPIYGDQVSVLPMLMVVSMFIQQRMMGGAGQQAQQKMMSYFMSGFFFLMFNNFPSGLNLYYTLFNVLTIAQQKFVPAAGKPAK
ncbi:MAG: membrane protein insertase YidC [Candidatus Marinimicrobia bacterium]|nr:membrane protein insertase YidC [Candidatus Neomarinimicrobiota bacterium]